MTVLTCQRNRAGYCQGEASAGITAITGGVRRSLAVLTHYDISPPGWVAEELRAASPGAATSAGKRAHRIARQLSPASWPHSPVPVLIVPAILGSDRFLYKHLTLQRSRAILARGEARPDGLRQHLTQSHGSLRPASCRVTSPAPAVLSLARPAVSRTQGDSWLIGGHGDGRMKGDLHSTARGADRDEDGHLLCCRASVGCGVHRRLARALAGRHALPPPGPRFSKPGCWPALAQHPIRPAAAPFACEKARSTRIHLPDLQVTRSSVRRHDRPVTPAAKELF